MGRCKYKDLTDGYPDYVLDYDHWRCTLPTVKTLAEGTKTVLALRKKTCADDSLACTRLYTMLQERMRTHLVPRRAHHPVNQASIPMCCGPPTLYWVDRVKTKDL